MVIPRPPPVRPLAAELAPPRAPEPARILSDLQKGCDLDQIIEEKVKDAPVTLTLRQFLAACQAGHGGVPERLIGTIRRKRTVGVHAIHGAEDGGEATAEEQFWSAACYRNAVAPADAFPEHAATEPLWARPVSETQIFIPGLDREVTALIDSGSEINLVERWVCEAAGWPMVAKPGWTIHTAVGQDEIYAACPGVSLVIGDFSSRHNLFVQNTIGYPLLLGQPWRARLRYASLWRGDGTEVGQVMSPDGERVLRFTVVQKSDQRHRCQLNHRPDRVPSDFDQYLKEGDEPPDQVQQPNTRATVGAEEPDSTDFAIGRA